MLWMLAIATALSADPAIRFDVQVWQVDDEAAALLERAASCRPPALLGRDALPLAVRALEDRPGATLESQPTLVAPLGEPATLTVAKAGAEAAAEPELELELVLKGSVFAPGMLDVSLQFHRVEGELDQRAETAWRMADGARGMLRVGDAWVMVHPTVVDSTDSGTWSDGAQMEALAALLIGDGPRGKREKALERVMAGCR